MSALFVVATPIGNLEDITFRAVRILSEVDLIVAEDTRKTRILLDRYQIHTPMTSFHNFNAKHKAIQLIETIKAGKNIAIVSEAGMPGISDPGYEVIRKAIDQNIKVEVIPGPCAAVNALVASGLPTDKFVFVGFLPRKPGKKTKMLKHLKETNATVIIYESPFRVLKTLKDILLVFGDCQVAVCREMTKKFEEIIRGKLSDVIVSLENKKIKGEVVIVVS